MKCSKGTRKNKICEPDVIVANGSTPPKQVKRCPKGTRKNKKTGNCDSIQIEELVVSDPLTVVAEKGKRCPPKTRKNRKTGKCEPIDNPSTDKLKPVANKKQCAPGTKKNRKTAKCEPEVEEYVSSPDNNEYLTPMDNPMDNLIDNENIIDNVVEEIPGPVDLESPAELVNVAVNNTIPDISVFDHQFQMSTVDDTDPKKIIQLEKKKEKNEYYESKKEKQKYDFLYPTLNDANFSYNIASRKEFHKTRYDGETYPIKEKANEFCNPLHFELMPHQLFVKNFLSVNTPYTSLLLYHGLGSGKTCSAIGIAEEMRKYYKQVGIQQKIMIVASPNVQANFMLQLFDERKLTQLNKKTNKDIVDSDTVWNINSCIENSLLREINPANLKGIPKEKVIIQIKRIILQYYEFLGYNQMVNHILKYTKSEKQEYEINMFKTMFNNKLIIIDEVHNIPDNKKNEKASMLLLKIAKYAENVRFVFLSATPMYNTYKSIIWLTNLMNVNDKRSTIQVSDVFDSNGNFKKGNAEKNIESGDQLLMRKLTGYISYVRGENPYTFPYRVYPSVFSPKNKKLIEPYPTKQMNGFPVPAPLKHLELYYTKCGEYQQKAYNVILNSIIQNKHQFGRFENISSFESMETFGYTLLQPSIEALNIVYPNTIIDTYIQQMEEKTDVNENLEFAFIGGAGLDSIMTYKHESAQLLNANSDGEKTNFAVRNKFQYKPECENTYGKIFDPTILPNYSSKISNITQQVMKSTGIVIIYSQFIDGGVVPIALALEHLGFGKYCATPSHNKSLMRKPPCDPIDARTLTTTPPANMAFEQAKYIMITGDKTLSPKNEDDIKYATSPENKDGHRVKVIIITKAGSEGIDFNNIRQIHILEPWYNLNRIEQTIGRGVRNLSHCMLPFEERNVELYLHASVLKEKEKEAVDTYIYRFAENKSIQIGKVTRLLKSMSVDCVLNIKQGQLSVSDLQKLPANRNIQIHTSSSKKNTLKHFEVGDKPYSSICDYMETCEYSCNTNRNVNAIKPVDHTYSFDFAKTNMPLLILRIKALFRETTFYKFDQLLHAVNSSTQYPTEQIYYALTYLINNKNEYLMDDKGRLGNLINKENYYVFQPIEVTDQNISIYERSAPVEYKRDFYKLEIPSEIRENPNIEMSDDAVETTNIQTVENVLAQMMADFNTVFQQDEIIVTSSKEPNWYKNANNIVRHIHIEYEIPYAKMEEYVVYHMLDLTVFQTKMNLFQHWFSKKPIPPKLNKHITSYFEKRILTIDKKTCVIMIYKNNWKLYSYSSDEDENQNWGPAEPTDYQRFSKLERRFNVPRPLMNPFLGIFDPLNTNSDEMVFKVKNLNLTRNNKGSSCGYSTSLVNVIKTANSLLESAPEFTKYDSNDKSNPKHKEFCIIIEFLMRYFTDIKKNNKIYILSAEATIASSEL